MKNAFFFSKDKSKILKCRLLQFLFGALRVKITEDANSLDPDEAAHNKPSSLDLHCLPFTVFLLL